jgi:hypothetical protein
MSTAARRDPGEILCDAAEPALKRMGLRHGRHGSQGVRCFVTKIVIFVTESQFL